MLRIYCDLADQYKILDAASNVAKRNVLAEHLKEVIDVLEKKVRDHPVLFLSSLRIRRATKLRLYIELWSSKMREWSSQLFIAIRTVICQTLHFYMIR